jgi:hypothetical protein
MRIDVNQVGQANENAFCNGDELLIALDGLQPADSQKKNEMFAKIYPGIVRAIARKVPQKDILDMLKSAGLKLNPVRYRMMLDAEQKSRDEKGERICCDKCGASLIPTSKIDLSAGSEIANEESY